LVPSTVKVTLPVGTVVPEEAATVAVNVTVAPAVAGFALEVRLVLLAARVAALMVSVRLVLVLVANAVLPPYAAVIVCVPAASVEVA
jgi:hypothetical protein